MLAAIKTFALAGSPPHYQVALGFLAYAVLEWVLPRTKLVAANSTLELGANVAKKALLDKLPILGRLVKALATPVVGILIPIVFLTSIVLGMSGCATSATLKGATLTQKLHDDEAALKQVEVDVKTQCGDKFAPVAVQAGMILSIAYAVASVAAGDVTGAIHQALASFPTIVGDVQGLACVEKVLVADYKKFKPAALRTEAWALAQVCDSTAERGSALCRPITCDTDDEACLGVLLSTGRTIKVGDQLVFLDKDGETRVVADVVGATQ